jgi:hypothetical protein
MLLDTQMGNTEQIIGTDPKMFGLCRATTVGVGMKTLWLKKQREQRRRMQTTMIMLLLHKRP